MAMLRTMATTTAEKKEYNMREFNRLLEKNESSKIWGARRIGSDETAIR